MFNAILSPPEYPSFFSPNATFSFSQVTPPKSMCRVAVAVLPGCPQSRFFHFLASPPPPWTTATPKSVFLGVVVIFSVCMCKFLGLNVSPRLAFFQGGVLASLDSLSMTGYDSSALRVPFIAFEIRSSLACISKHYLRSSLVNWPVAPLPSQTFPPRNPFLAS